MNITNGLTYLAFSFDHPVEDAKKIFTARYGYAPVEIVLDDEPGLRFLRVGPVEVLAPSGSASPVKSASPLVSIPALGTARTQPTEQLVLSFDEE